MTTTHPTHAGEVVQDDSGQIGIITEPARKAGVYKGKVSVMWAGHPYTVVERPEELTVVDPAGVASFAATPDRHSSGGTVESAAPPTSPPHQPPSTAPRETPTSQPGCRPTAPTGAPTRQRS